MQNLCYDETGDWRTIDGLAGEIINVNTVQLFWGRASNYCPGKKHPTSQFHLREEFTEGVFFKFPMNIFKNDSLNAKGLQSCSFSRILR